MLVPGALTMGQEPAGPGTPPTAGVPVLEHLRSGHIEQALSALADAADSETGWPSPIGSGVPAAAGGLHRALAQLDAGERYDLLYAWSMPTEKRRTVRILTSLVPQNAPPKVFARVLGERPRDTSFPVAEINGVRGLFDSGWQLVTAADDLGRLRRLTAELESLAAEQVPGAQTLLLLARLADARGDLTELAQSLEARTRELRTAIADPMTRPANLDPANLVLAVAALRHGPLRPTSEDMLQSLVELTLNGTAAEVRPFLRGAHAIAVQLHRGQSGPEVFRENRLKHWVATSGQTSATNCRGHVDALWLAHEDHVLHLAGAGNDVLFLRYPLTGDFEFTCEAQEGGGIGTDGGLVFGGLQFQALGGTNQLTVWDADVAHHALKPCPFVWHENRPMFNRLAIRSTAEGATFAVNLHPVWWDGPESRQSPWIGLRSFAEKRPLFRNLKVTGQPVIPREVPLSTGDVLRGWQSQFYGELQPSTFKEKSQTTAEDPDWDMTAGVIHAKQRDLVVDGNSQSRLHYQRPLLDGESVSYEFYHTTGAAVIHPAFGQLAFLVEPDGVRVHWMTDGRHEWTGLPQDNALLEPLNRRGPRALPLKDNEWNRVTLARSNEQLTLSLNGAVIYERPLDFAGSQVFGFFRDRTKPAAQVRHVVLRGDWPDSLPAELLETSSVTGNPSRSATSVAVNAIVGDDFLAANVATVRRRAAGMNAADRFNFLREWILPVPADGRSHGFRVTGEFTQTQPAPVPNAPTGRTRTEHGPELVSPVFDLLDCARELHKLEELRQQIEDLPDSADTSRQRAKLALLVLVHWERNDRDAAARALDKLYPLVAGTTPAGLADVWPQTLVAYRGVHRDGGHEAVGDLLGLMHQQFTMRRVPDGVEFWHTHIAAMMGRYQHLAFGGESDAFDMPHGLRDWVPVVRTRARSRGPGHALACWHRNEAGEVHHLSGHQEEYLFYRSPLRGNFDVTCEIGAYGTTQVLAAGTFCGPVTDLGLLEQGTFRGGAAARVPVDPPFSRFDPWVHYRAAFRDGVCTAYLNGRPVYSEKLSEHHDPWIGLRSWWRNGARFRDVRITGKPDIPEEVLLSASPTLVGWLAYHEESAGYAGACWQHVADPESSGWIVGRRDQDLANTFAESLLTYQRPLVEDGSVEYEFFYEPGRIETHPALDRLAFLLQPDGVRLHWITDSPFDRSTLPPDNVFDEPDNRRGPESLPLKPMAWNRLRLSIVGRMLSLWLNGELVYQRPLEPNNLRTFGLFHFVGNTEARVRNVVLRGDWPRTLPTAGGQELADPVVVALDADLPQLQAVFSHDFARDGLPAEYFQYKDSRGGSELLLRPDGVHVHRPAAGNWISAEIAARFVARGDFDLVAEYDRLETTGESDASIMLVARLADESLHHCRSVRNRIRDQRQVFQISLSAVDRDGRRTYDTKQFTCEAKSGRLRVARRGKEVFYLLANGDSPNYRLFGKEVVSDADTLPGGIDLSVVANGTATASVVWKNLQIAAEELLLPPDPSAKPKNVLFVMNADGTGLEQLTQEMPESQSHGSPDWSPDGKQIAFDAWGGAAGSAHVLVVNADGTGLKDLGLGLMPTFSPDGRQLAFTWSSRGIGVMNTDGTRREVISDEGWGAQWSPDGKWIAYESRHLIGNNLAANITIINVETKERRQLLEGEHATRYSQIYWNMEWSPDSRRICFKGALKVPVTGAASEVAIAHVAGSSDGFRVLTMAHLQTDFSWHPNGRSILVSMNSPQHAGIRLFLCDSQTGELSLLPAQPLDQKNTSGVWSPDGRRIVFSSQRELKLLPWRPSEAN